MNSGNKKNSNSENTPTTELAQFATQSAQQHAEQIALLKQQHAEQMAVLTQQNQHLINLISTLQISNNPPLPPASETQNNNTKSASQTLLDQYCTLRFHDLSELPDQITKFYPIIDTAQADQPASPGKVAAYNFVTKALGNLKRSFYENTNENPAVILKIFTACNNNHTLKSVLLRELKNKNLLYIQLTHMNLHLSSKLADKRLETLTFLIDTGRGIHRDHFARSVLVQSIPPSIFIALAKEIYEIDPTFDPLHLPKANFTSEAKPLITQALDSATLTGEKFALWRSFVTTESTQKISSTIANSNEENSPPKLHQELIITILSQVQEESKYAVLSIALAELMKKQKLASDPYVELAWKALIKRDISAREFETVYACAPKDFIHTKLPLYLKDKECNVDWIAEHISSENLLALPASLKLAVCHKMIISYQTSCQEWLAKNINPYLFFDLKQKFPDLPSTPQWLDNNDQALSEYQKISNTISCFKDKSGKVTSTIKLREKFNQIELDKVELDTCLSLTKDILEKFSDKKTMLSFSRKSPQPTDPLEQILMKVKATLNAITSGTIASNINLYTNLGELFDDITDKIKANLDLISNESNLKSTGDDANIIKKLVCLYHLAAVLHPYPRTLNNPGLSQALQSITSRQQLDATVVSAVPVTNEQELKQPSAPNPSAPPLGSDVAVTNLENNNFFGVVNATVFAQQIPTQAPADGNGNETGSPAADLPQAMAVASPTTPAA